MSTWMMRSTAQAMIAARQAEADQIRIALAHQDVPSPRPTSRTARLAGPLAVIAALAMLLVSIPVLSAAPGTPSPAPMPSPTPGAAPALQR